jgi:class 3 adenylate cyclase
VEAKSTATVDELLDRAIEAVNRGDVEVAHQLANEVLAADATNPEAGDLLATDVSMGGELRRLTIMFCDLVGSTAMSARHEPERYRRIIVRYKSACRRVIEEQYDGHIADVKGDGVLAVFGHPSAHEDDAERAVRAGLEIAAEVLELSGEAQRGIGETLAARVAVHRGLVFLDTEEDDIYGLAVNVAARLQELAPPGGLVISDEVLRLVGNRFETAPQAAQAVKGVEAPLASWVVVRERFGRRVATHRWPAPLLGRDEELERLRAAWQARPGAVLVRGEPGMGKSRLVGALAAEVGAGADVVEVAGSPFHTGAGFHPLRTLIEDRCGIRADDDGSERLGRLRSHLAAGGLDELVPLLAPVLGIAPAAGFTPPASDAHKLHEEITDAMGRYLATALGAGPAMLIAEDVQWFDESTADLVTRLAERAPDGALVVLTARPGVRPPSSAATLDLGPLAPADSVALAVALDPEAHTTAGAREALVARSDGVPLYLEELVRAAVEAPDDGRRAATDRPGPPAASAVPEVLYEPLVARLYATAADVRVVQAAATIGRSLDRGLLVDVAGVDEATLDASLEALLSALILEREPGPAERYRFRHALIREVAYGLQPPSTRQGMHGRVADAIGSAIGASGITDWLLLAGHYEEAQRPGEAVDCYARAADEARGRGALTESRAHLTRAIDLVSGLPESTRRNGREIQLLLRRGFLAVSSEGNASPQAAADYERCLELAMRDRSQEEMFQALISLWGYYASRADLPRSRQVLELLRTVMTAGHEWFAPENEAGFGILDWFAGDFVSAQELLEHAAAEVLVRGRDERVGAVWYLPNDPMTAIFTHLALARFVRGDAAGAHEALATADRLAGELPFPQGPFSAAYNGTYAAWIHLQEGALDRAEVVVTDTLALAERHGFSFWILAATTQRVLLDALRAAGARPIDGAALDASAGTLEALVSAWRLVDTRLFLPAVITMLGTTRLIAGNGAAAAEQLDDALVLAQETGVEFCVAETLRARAHLAPQPVEVAARLREALDIARRQGAVVFQLRIARDLFVLEGEPERATVAEALAAFPPGASSPDLDAVRTLVG